MSPVRFVQVILNEDGFIMGDKDEAKVAFIFTIRTENRKTLWVWKWFAIIVIQVEALFILVYKKISTMFMHCDWQVLDIFRLYPFLLS